MSKEDFQRLVNKRRKPVIKFRFSMLFFIFFLTISACFAMHMADANINDDEFIKRLYSNNTNSQNSISNTDTASVQVINPVPASDIIKDESYWNDCAFMGDYVMSDIAKEFGNTENIFAGNSYNTSNIPQIDNNNFKNIYILLGCSDIAEISSDKLIASIKTCIQVAKSKNPDCTIYLLAIPPVSEEREKMSFNSVQNSTIDNLNSQLLNLANTEFVYYVDINTALKGNNGKLPSSYVEEDNINLTKETYKIICDYILSHTVA